MCQRPSFLYFNDAVPKYSHHRLTSSLPLKKKYNEKVKRELKMHFQNQVLALVEIT